MSFIHSDMHLHWSLYCGRYWFMLLAFKWFVIRAVIW